MTRPGRSATHAKKRETKLVVDIAIRAVGKAAEMGLEVGKTDVIMAVLMVHQGDHPLRLEELLTADDVNFCHDVFGILRYLDPKLGELTDCFIPRFARRS